MADPNFSLTSPLRNFIAACKDSRQQMIAQNILTLRKRAKQESNRRRLAKHGVPMRQPSR